MQLGMLLVAANSPFLERVLDALVVGHRVA